MSLCLVAQSLPGQANPKLKKQTYLIMEESDSLVCINKTWMDKPGEAGVSYLCPRVAQTQTHGQLLQSAGILKCPCLRRLQC